MNGGRVTCPRCGANNFEAVVACWKCGAALTPPVANPTQPVYPNPGVNEARRPMPNPGNVTQPVYPVSAVPPLMGDPKAAQRAAIWMGLSLPYFGYPIGWAFIMMEDHRRQAMGRACIFWSTIGLVAHLVLMTLASAALTPMLVKMLVPMISGGQNGGAGTGNLDDTLRKQIRGLDSGNP